MCVLNSRSDCKSKTPGFVGKTQSNKKAALWRFSKANIKGAWRKVSELDANSCHMFYVLVKEDGVREKTSTHRWHERSVSPNPRMHVFLAYACRVCMFRMQVPKNRLPGKDCRFSLNPCGLGYEMICYSYHAPWSCWLHAAVSMRGLHVHTLILLECITPRVPKMWPQPNLTVIKQRAPARDATSLCEHNLISVHELLWHGSCEVCRRYSKGMVTWGHCLIIPHG